MQRAQQTCGNCGGRGVQTVWVVDNTPPVNGCRTTHAEDVTCTNCAGSGYLEYARFTVEEAEAILEYCGIKGANKEGEAGMAKKKKTAEGLVKKEDVIQLIQNYIRNIQMNDYGKDSGIPQLYAVMSQIEKLSACGYY